MTLVNLSFYYLCVSTDCGDIVGKEKGGEMCVCVCVCMCVCARVHVCICVAEKSKQESQHKPLVSPQLLQSKEQGGADQLPSFIYLFLAIPRTCRSSQARDQTHATAGTMLDP